jgi:hypothetical protein
MSQWCFSTYCVPSRFDGKLGPAVIVIMRRSFCSGLERTADDPERGVAPIETDKPKKDEPNLTTIPATSSVESIAVEATASPSSEIIEESTRFPVTAAL